MFGERCAHPSADKDVNYIPPASEVMDLLEICVLPCEFAARFQQPISKFYTALRDQRLSQARIRLNLQYVHVLLFSDQDTIAYFVEASQCE